MLVAPHHKGRQEGLVVWQAQLFQTRHPVWYRCANLKSCQRQRFSSAEAVTQRSLSPRIPHSFYTAYIVHHIYINHISWKQVTILASGMCINEQPPTIRNTTVISWYMSCYLKFQPPPPTVPSTDFCIECFVEHSWNTSLHEQWYRRYRHRTSWLRSPVPEGKTDHFLFSCSAVVKRRHRNRHNTYTQPNKCASPTLKKTTWVLHSAVHSKSSKIVHEIIIKKISKTVILLLSY